MKPYPTLPTPAPPAPPKATRKGNWWLGLAFAVAAAVVVLGIVFLRTRPAENRGENFPDLPEWFDRAHRIRSAERVDFVEGIGLLLPPPIESSSQFSAQWLEKNFTHYVAENAFVWATPKYQYPSHGKIFGGNKLIASGKEVGDFSLVCGVSNDGRAINFFMETKYLRDRSKGPPEIRDDD